MSLDFKLRNRLSKLEAQHDVLTPIVERLKELEANEDALWSKLYLEAEGKNVEERKAKAYAHKDWIQFNKALKQAQADFINEQRWFEVRMKAYDAEHVTYKNETPVIKRQA